MNVERFDLALRNTLDTERLKNGIGTYSEGTLHAVLKKYFEPSSERHELNVGRYVADIVGQDGIIEIQTKQLFRMKNKIKAFLEVSDVTVVYPVSSVRYVSWVDSLTGEVLNRRKSPRKGNLYEAMVELYALREFLSDPGFHFTVVMLETEELKDFKVNKYGKKTSVRRIDRIPLKFLSEEKFFCKEDYYRLIPEGIDDNFTSADFAKSANISRSLAQYVLNLFNVIGVVKRVDRNKSGYIYSVCR